jgi:UDP-N-acetylmuramoylalanine--D-glutamate ligase
MGFKNKKILVMGLGLLGGGVAVTKWLTRHGAKVTVTDLKTRRELLSSIKSLGPAAKKIRFVLGKHRVADFKNNEIIIVNPGVPRTSKFLKIAKKAGAELENEASIFFAHCRNPIIGVTGTRGKTTTVNWLYHLLKKKYPRAVLTGNSSASPMLDVLDKLDGKNPVVVELSSWHLELLPKSKKSPRIAVITNIYPDHLNRYPSMRSYVLAKASIFEYQNERDCLILNRGNGWTKFFLKLKPRAGISYFPGKSLIDKGKFVQERGLHNFENMAAATLAARTFGLSEALIKSALKNLPEIQYREEVILKKKNLLVVNDATATTPEATIAALTRFTRFNLVRLVLIAGGTDKKLNFKEWAREVRKRVEPENLYLLEGSATKKMVRELNRISYFKKTRPRVFKELKEILRGIRNKESGIILFSPGATSFEKFINEFDRGRKFDLYANKYFKNLPR